MAAARRQWTAFMTSRRLLFASLLATLTAIPVAAQPVSIVGASAAESEALAAPRRELLDQYCVTCHNDAARQGDLSLEGVDLADPTAHVETLEKVARKLRAGLMPPPRRPRPDAPTLTAFVSGLEAAIELDVGNDIGSSLAQPANPIIPASRNATSIALVRHRLTIPILKTINSFDHSYSNLPTSSPKFDRSQHEEPSPLSWTGRPSALDTQRRVQLPPVQLSGPNHVGPTG